MDIDNKNIKEERKNLIDLVLGAYLSIRHPIAYVSMPITSGKILYDVLEKKGVRNIEELIKQDPNSLYNDIIKPNVEMGMMAGNIQTEGFRNLLGQCKCNFYLPMYQMHLQNFIKE